MPCQNIDATLSPADIKAIKAAFDTILGKMPFLVNLTPDERRSMFKTGPDSVSFVQNALTATEDHPGILPRDFKTGAFRNDVVLFSTLTETGALAASVASQIDDTRIAAGSESMQEATQVYHYVQTAARTTQGLKPVADQLSERFRKLRRRRKPENLAK